MLLQIMATTAMLLLLPSLALAGKSEAVVCANAMAAGSCLKQLP